MGAYTDEELAEFERASQDLYSAHWRIRTLATDLRRERNLHSEALDRLEMDMSRLRQERDILLDASMCHVCGASLPERPSPELLQSAQKAAEKAYRAVLWSGKWDGPETRHEALEAAVAAAVGETLARHKNCGRS